MSLPQLQKAVALLIRLPQANRAEALESFLGEFELSSYEREQVSSLAASYEVEKYGHSMAGVRWEKIERALTLSRLYLGEDLARFLWVEHFEPKHTKTTFYELGYRYLQFIYGDSECQKIIRNKCPSYMNDIIRFESARANFRLIDPYYPTLSSSSLLRHNRLAVIDLNWDIPALLLAMRSGELRPEAPTAPTKRRFSILLLREEGRPHIRNFELGDQEAAFLKGQLKGEASDLPDSYDDLVQIGLCQNTQGA